MLQSKEIKELLLEIANMIVDSEDELSRLDGVIGDGDHGISMKRGALRGIEVLNEMSNNEPINEYFKNYGWALVRVMGGAMGPLVGIIFTEFGKACKDKSEFGPKEFTDAITGSTNKVQEFGGARLGDKTMVDAMIPTMEAATISFEAGDDFNTLLDKSYEAALQGVENTVALMARKGRSKWLREKSIGHPDAGATSYSKIIGKIREFVSKR